MSRALSGTRVTVAVLTYLRPDDLRVLLPMLLEQLGDVASLGVIARVLIVDNDPAGGAADLVSAFAGAGIGYVHEAVPGITAGRNRALDESELDNVLVFLDDDERPDQHWLRALLETWADSDAEAVVGPVRSDFSGELDTWVAAGAFFQRRRLATGTSVEVAATNNLLLDLTTVRRLNLRFDPRFGVSGAEDTYFTRTLARRGGRMIWCAEAMVTDVVPAARMTRQWVLRRSFSSGNADVLAAVELESSGGGRLRQRASGFVRGALRATGGGLRYLVGELGRSAHHQTRGLRTAYRGAGMLAGAAGLAYLEYSRGPHRKFRLHRFRTLSR